MPDINATVKGYSRVKTKKDLKAMVAAINRHEPEAEVDIEINDLMFGFGITAGVSDLLKTDQPGYASLLNATLRLTNAARTWFASVSAKNGKLVVT